MLPGYSLQDMRSGARRRKGARRCEAERGTAEAMRSVGGAVLGLGGPVAKAETIRTKFLESC